MVPYFVLLSCEQNKSVEWRGDEADGTFGKVLKIYNYSFFASVTEQKNVFYLQL